MSNLNYSPTEDYQRSRRGVSVMFINKDRMEFTFNDDRPDDPGGDSQDSSLLQKNVNAESVANLEKEKREKSKIESDKKKEKDKTDREAQKQKQTDRKESEKKRTQKGERRR
ncbi:Hypothetical predicted protein [Mytilus galloprovincialis]|uniref:Coiled-coil domain-containing protein 43 n=1 Tax=Mytilus galloprovincialis TaxID=29158 RepID=A0A8B6FWZ7_MYTGA|nr:Hypothetical predicted protein [Mytilus galloprovincialis]